MPRLALRSCLSPLFFATLSVAACAAPQRPPITGIAHVSLAAQDMQADRTFYTHTLGWKESPSPEADNGLRFSGDGRQSVEVVPVDAQGELALQHVAWATPDVGAMRLYLASKGVAVPAGVTQLANGARYFRVKDPEGNVVEFYQRAPGLNARPHNIATSISGRIIHAGFIVHSADAENRFYRDILGFHLYWTGGMKDGVIDFVSMQVPNGTDWLEYMLNNGDHPSARQISVADHFSLGVQHMDTVLAELAKRGFPPGAQQAKQLGRDGKIQLNLYDPDKVRVEFMEFVPVAKPCCHAIVGRNPGANDPE